MSVDLGDLLRRSSPGPGAPLDPDDVWARGRKRRRTRLALTSAAGVVAIGVLAVAPLTLLGSPQPVVEPLGPVEQEAPPEPIEEPPPPEPEEPPAPEPEETETGPIDEAGPADPVTEDDDPVEEPGDETSPAETEVTPGPDPDRLADPCAVHEGGEMRAFIDVVAPVGGQEVADAVDLVGCASVFEATVSYRLLDAPGTVLIEWFTTATAGGPEIGEFRETIDLEGATGELTLEVFWVDASDGSDRDLQTVTFTATG